MSTLAPILQSFFTDRLRQQRHTSGRTITAYRDAIRLLLVYAAARTSKTLSTLDIADLDAPLIGAFLNHLETERRNSVRTRNARLAAIHSLFHHAAAQRPDDAAVIQRVLAIPPKRFDRTLVSYLSDDEVTALLAAPDPSTWTGRRDHALIMLGCQTGLRASELLHLTHADVHLGSGPHVSCLGKGRKQRITPLTAATVTILRAWQQEHPSAPTDPLFPTRRGTPLTRDGLQRRLTGYAIIATRSCPSLHGKRITPHVMRHTAAMRLLSAGVDSTVIALWLGHETVATTQIYIHADLALKQKALARTTPNHATPGRYQPTDAILAFLDSL
jgi:site-specific recombinase XerD